MFWRSTSIALFAMEWEVPLLIFTRSLKEFLYMDIRPSQLNDI